MSQPPPVLHDLTDNVEQTVDLLRRDPQRTPFGLRAVSFRVRFADIGVRRARLPCAGRSRARGRGCVAGSAGSEHRRARGEIAEEIVDGLLRPGYLRAQHGGSAKQRRSESRREYPRAAHAGQHVLDSMREHADVVEAEHPGRPLDGVRVAEQRVHGLGTRIPGFDGE